MRTRGGGERGLRGWELGAAVCGSSCAPRPTALPAPVSDPRHRSVRGGQSGCGRGPAAGSVTEMVPPPTRNAAGPAAGNVVPDRELGAVASGRGLQDTRSLFVFTALCLMLINSPSVRPSVLRVFHTSAQAFNQETVFEARVPDTLHRVLGDTETGDSARGLRGLPAKGP